MNEEQALNERIGAPETLAAAARIEYQRRSFAGRHPVLTFVAAPVFAAPAAVCFFTLAAALAAHAVGALFWPETLDYLEAGAPTPDWVTTFVLGFCATVRFVPFAATAALFAHLGRRVCRPNWGLVACGMIALLAGLFAATVRPPLAGDDRSSLTLALSPALDLRQLFQAVVPLACGVWLLRRAPLAPANPLAA